MSQTFIKSDISILEEFHMQGKKQKPVYEFTNTCDTACKKVCLAKFMNLESKGQGHSKKKAKHAAATKLLKALYEKHPEILSKLQPERKLEDITTIEDKCHLLLENNLIGQLFEKCVRDFLPPPRFKIISAVTRRGYSQYIMECTVIVNLEWKLVTNVRKLATGPSKKQAKHTVSKMMLDALESLPIWSQIDETELSKYCIENHIATPSFEIISPDSTDKIHVKCTAGEIEETGTGTTEEQAKLTAARMAYITLRLEGTSMEAVLPHPNHIIGTTDNEQSAQTGDAEVVGENQFMEIPEEAVPQLRNDDIGTTDNEQSAQTSDTQVVDENRTMEIPEEGVPPLRNDDIVTTDNEQSAQTGDAEVVDENRTMEIPEEPVPPIRNDDIGTTDNEQSAQTSDTQVVDEKEIMEIPEEAVSPIRNDDIGTTDSEQSVQTSDTQVVDEDETMEISDE